MVIHYYRALLNMREGRGVVHCMASRGRGPLPPILSPSAPNGSCQRRLRRGGVGKKEEEEGGGAERKQWRERDFHTHSASPSPSSLSSSATSSFNGEREGGGVGEATQCKIAH